MGQEELINWLDQWTNRLGADRVRRVAIAGDGLSSAETNVSLFRPRYVPATLRPVNVEQVREIVRSASEMTSVVPLYPLSKGRNWGIGSREPVEDGSVVLDLSDLNRVRFLDPAVGVAVVEPGVTQRQLAGYLAGTGHMLNVTSSSPDTSVVGNGLERGVGLRRQRCEDITGLEVVLADGTVLQLGSWPDGKGRIVPYRNELGPALMPLFMQSNFGVVTAAVVRLVPRPEALQVVRFAFNVENLTRAVDELHSYCAQRLVNGVLKVYIETAIDPCVAYCCVDGDRDLVDDVTSVLMLRATAKGVFDDIRLLETDRPESDLRGDRIRRCLWGDPNSNEDMIRREFGVGAAEVDTGSSDGFLFFFPLIPFQGAAVAEAYELLREVGAETGTRWSATVNAISCDVIDLVISSQFPRTLDVKERAHQALDMLYERFPEAGMRPYRLDIEHMHKTAGLAGSAARQTLVRQMKNLLDPKAILAPGRYCIS